MTYFLNRCGLLKMINNGLKTKIGSYKEVVIGSNPMFSGYYFFTLKWDKTKRGHYASKITYPFSLLAIHEPVKGQ